MDNWKKVISSPIRWAGSKISLLNDLLTTFDRNKDYYIEPFLGSGAVLINVLNNNDILSYKKIYVNDANPNIIDFYKRLKKDGDTFIEKLERIVNNYNSLNTLEEKSKMYYQIRDSFNDNDNKNVYFFFLMKTCFNGVYRENSKGLFNVPFGKKEKIFCDRTKLIFISTLLKKVEFYNEDYSVFFKILKKKRILNNAFVYCDPPYIPDDDSVYKTQTLYSKPIFKHEHFYDEVSNIASFNCSVIISMSDSSRANDIYNNGVFKKKEIKDLFRIVNPKRRFSSKEIIFTNI